MLKHRWMAVAAFTAVVAASGAVEVRQIFRAERFQRGDTRAGQARDGGRRVGARAVCTVRPAFLAWRVHPQGGGRVPQAAHDRRRILARRGAEERHDAQGRPDGRQAIAKISL